MNNPNNPTDKPDADQKDPAAPEAQDADVTDAQEVDAQDAGSDDVSEPSDDVGAEDVGAETEELSTEAEDTLDAEPEKQESTSDPEGPDQPDDAAYVDESQGQGSSFAATALKLLLLVLVIFGLSLWLVPMAAPYLPAGIAERVMPGQKVLDERIAAIEARVAEASEVATGNLGEMQQQISDLTERLSAAEAAAKAAGEEAVAAREAAMAPADTGSGEVDAEASAAIQAAALEAAETSATATAAATEAGKVASAAMRDTASLARQMTSFEARLANLKSEIQAIGDNLASAATQEGGASTAEVAAAFAALKARVDTLSESEPDLTAYMRRDESDGFATHDDLRSARTALGADLESALAALPDGGVLATSDDVAELRGSVDGQVSALTDRITEIGGKAESAAAAASQAEAAATEAVGTVAGAIRGASVKSATASLSSRMANGLPFAGALDEVVQLTGASAPEGLSTVAATGVQTTEMLIRRFKPLAPKAIAAELKAQSGDDPLGQASARLQSVFAGRPKNEQPGNDTSAIVSRVEARLADAEVAAALDEAEALSDAAKAGLGGWLDDLRARVGADAAAAAFLAEIGASQG